MNIDKTRFLVLAAALAASTVVAAGAGCTVNTTNSESDGGADPTTADGGSTTHTDGGSLGDSSTEGGACLADNGDLPACADANKCQAECRTAGSFFKSDVASSINDCIVATVPATPAQTDCTNAASACVKKAVGQACDDDTAAAFCTQFLASCPDQPDGGATTATQADCVTFARAMTDSGRTDLQNCVTVNQGTCTDCIASLSTVSGSQ